MRSPKITSNIATFNEVSEGKITFIKICQFTLAKLILDTNRKLSATRSLTFTLAIIRYKSVINKDRGYTQKGK
jgi:hypothetical protein